MGLRGGGGADSGEGGGSGSQVVFILLVNFLFVLLYVQWLLRYFKLLFSCQASLYNFKISFDKMYLANFKRKLCFYPISK